MANRITKEDSKVTFVTLTNKRQKVLESNDSPHPERTLAHRRRLSVWVSLYQFPSGTTNILIRCGLWWSVLYWHLHRSLKKKKCSVQFLLVHLWLYKLCYVCVLCFHTHKYINTFTHKYTCSHTQIQTEKHVCMYTHSLIESLIHIYTDFCNLLLCTLILFILSMLATFLCRS